MQKKIILTGFKPFGAYEHNPTQDAVNYFHGHCIDGYEIIGVVLPCAYYGAFDILELLMEKQNPYAVISMGLSSSVKGVRIETTFRNLMWSKYTDVNYFRPINEPIEKKYGSKEFLSSLADNTDLANILHKNRIPVEVSANADTFICNSLGYLTTQKIIEEELEVKNMFIHIPWTDNYEDIVYVKPNKIFLEKEKLYDAIRLLVENI